VLVRRRGLLLTDNHRRSPGIKRCRKALPQAVIWLLLAVCTPSAFAEKAPSTQLPGATVPRAKALSLDAALLRGWKLIESGRDYAVFETPLDEPASIGPPDASRSEPTLLRIRADFAAVKDGVQASLRAEEVWRAGTTRAWSNDITALYRDNLLRALQSLNTQWSHLVEPTAKTKHSEHGADPHDNWRRSDDPTPSGASRRLGTWAFDAEQLAQDHGCQLDDRGAVLASETPNAELHHVGCSNRTTLSIGCDRLRCWVEP